MLPDVEIVGQIRTWREQSPPVPYEEISRRLRTTGIQMGKTKVRLLYNAHLPGRTIVAVGDIHANPYTPLIDLIVNESPHLIVVGGDLLDAASFSTHIDDKGKTHETIKQEIKRSRDFLIELLARTSTNTHIEIIRGNHDDRLHKMITAILPEDVVEMVTDPLELTIKGLERTRLVNMDVRACLPSGHSRILSNTSHMMLYGDALVSHANFSGKDPGMAVKKLAGWTREWRRVLGWDELALLIQFHGHKISFCEVEGGWQIWVEPGMGGEPKIEHYKIGYNLKWNPGSIGAVSFKQQYIGGGWKTNYSSVKLLRPDRSRDDR